MPILRSLSLIAFFAGLWLFQQPTPGPKFVGGALLALSTDRMVPWKPGVTYNGGIPHRTTNCPASVGGPVAAGTSEATLQADLNGCSANQVLRLACGTFNVSGTPPLQLTIANVTIRGSTNADGSPCTLIAKTDGTAVGADCCSDANSAPAFTAGTSYQGKWCTMSQAPACSTPGSTGTVNVTTDGAAGGLTVGVTSTTGLFVNEYVLLDVDEFTSGTYVNLPLHQGSSQAAEFQSDRVVWDFHNPISVNGYCITDDTTGACPNGQTQCSDGGVAPQCRTDGYGHFRDKRPYNEIKKIAAIDATAKTVTFATPMIGSYPLTKTPQLTAWADNGGVLRDGIGVENLHLTGGDDGDLSFYGCNGCWALGVNLETWKGEGVMLVGCYRCEVRDSYIHDAGFSEPGGGAYAVSFQNGSSEGLVENDIHLGVNKVIVGRSAGTGNVIAYNYFDDGFISTDHAFQEAGLNGSHNVGSHHWLFEGNEAFNSDSDNTHGAAIYMVQLRNHLIGTRRAISVDYHVGGSGATCTVPGTQPNCCCTNPAPSAHTGNEHAAGVNYGSWWHSWVGDVLGVSGAMSGWSYDNPWTDAGSSPGASHSPSIWQLGYQGGSWDQLLDPKVLSTAVREGNFDYVTNGLTWDTSPHNLPISWYVNGLNFTALTPPPFWPSACHYPWVDPTGTTKLYTLPARWRYDQGTPFTATSPC